MSKITDAIVDELIDDLYSQIKDYAPDTRSKIARRLLFKVSDQIKAERREQD